MARGSSVKQSAGTILYRNGPAGLEVLLIHASGAYNRNAKWGFPKGGIEEGELPEAAARRETWEETGVKVVGDLVPLGHIDYTRSRKRIFGFAGPAPADAEPHCASWEIDGAEFMSIKKARKVIHPDQEAFLDRLEEHLSGPGGKHV